MTRLYVDFDLCFELQFEDLFNLGTVILYDINAEMLPCLNRISTVCSLKGIRNN